MDEAHARTSAIDTNVTHASIFDTIEALTEESRPSPTKDSNLLTLTQLSILRVSPRLRMGRQSSVRAKIRIELPSLDKSDSMPATLVTNSLCNLSYNHQSVQEFHIEQRPITPDTSAQPENQLPKRNAVRFDAGQHGEEVIMSARGVENRGACR